jgi:filamentous hemagglutinin family protein
VNVLKHLKLLVLGFLLLGTGMSSSALAELPTGYQTQAGTATYQNDGSTLSIDASHGAIINYQNFNIGQNNTVNINSPLSLHRVLGGTESRIMGNLNSSGQVFLVNPSGIFFGQGSQVNVSSLTASTLNIKDEDFTAGKYLFQKETGKSSAGIKNEGLLTGTQSISLLGGAIENSGTIQAPNVNLAVGEKMTVSVGSGLTTEISP